MAQVQMVADTGPVDVPEFNGEKLTDKEVSDAIRDAAKDELRNKVKESLTNDGSDCSK